MNKWERLLVVSLVLIWKPGPASAAGYYNLGANVQPVSPQFITEYGYIAGPLQSSDCPTGAYVQGISYNSGWVIDGVRFICSDASTTTSYLGGSSAANTNANCTGADNDVAAVQINSHGYANSICYIRMACRDGSISQFGGNGAGGCGSWQPVQVCPPGYAITGATSHFGGSTYFASLGLTCRYTNRSHAMMGYWNLNETGGTTATDLSGNSNTGTYQTGTTLNQTGVISTDGKAVLFNGMSGYMSTATSLNLTNSHSISVWFKTTSATKMGIFGFENLQTGTGSTWHSSSLETETDGRLTFYFWNGTAYTITTTGTYKDGNWHHVVASIGLGGTQLWVDGTLAAQNTSITSSGSYTGYWRLGHNRRANAYFNGTLDNFAVYKGQLSSSEVASLAGEAGVICGGTGDSCYNDTIAQALGAATTPLGKSLEYVDADGAGSGTFKVWKEKGGSRILRANGLDEWAKALNGNGNGQSGTDFTDANLGTASTVIRGRVCPPNVYVSSSDKFSTTNCLYVSPQYGPSTLNASGTNGISGLNNWGTINDGKKKWMVGNILLCSGKGMRLPTIYETDTTNTSDYRYPNNDPYNDGSPTTFAQSNGVAAVSGDTWTATTYQDDTMSYFFWSTNDSVAGWGPGMSMYIICVLP